MSTSTADLGAWSTPLDLSTESSSNFETTYHSPVYQELLAIREEKKANNNNNTTNTNDTDNDNENSHIPSHVSANKEASTLHNKNRVQFLTDSQQQSALSLAINKKIVIDAGAIIHSARLEKYGSEFYTTPSVLSEIKSSKSRQKLMLFPFEIKVRQPSNESLSIISSYAQKTGDYASLSGTDLSVLALAYEMEVEVNGKVNIKPEPPTLGISGYKKVQLTPYTELLNDMYGTADKYNKSEVHEDEESEGEEEEAESQHSEQPQHSSEEEESSSSTACCDHHHHHADEEEGEEEDDGWEVPKNAVKSIRRGADGKKLARRYDNGLKNEDDNNNDNDDNYGEYEEDDEEEGGQWITQSNINEYKNRNIAGNDEKWDDDDTHRSVVATAATAAETVTATETNEEEEEGTTTTTTTRTENTAEQQQQQQQQQQEPPVDNTRKVGCITTDFSMQNVLLHVGLNLVSVDGRRIRHLTRFVNRCYACSTLVPDQRRVFCPNCGNDTLKKVSCVVNDKGEAKFYYNPKRRINLRGSKYVIPMPKGGRNSRDPILREDQLSLFKGGKPHKAKLTLGRNKGSELVGSNIWQPEYTFEGSFGGGAHKGRPYERFNRAYNGYGRRNPNESIKTGAHKKKKSHRV